MANERDTPLDHELWMRQAIAEAERARGATGDNPWVGCMLIDAHGQVLGRGHTQGPGEDHAEIVAVRQAHARGLSVEGSIMYSTLEPCSFHGRTPACSRFIVDHRIGLLVFGMNDPNPRVDGEGARILRSGGVGVLERVCEREVRRQLGSWVLAYHPHEPRRRARQMATALGRVELVAALADIYAIEPALAEEIVASSEAGGTSPSP